MPVGVILAFLAYASFSAADALIKATGSAMSVFEIAFFTTSFSIIPAMLTKRGERWRDLYKLQHPWLVHLRCAAAISSTACVMYAFTHIPFAEVYAIGFLTPVVVTLLGVVLLKEYVAAHRWLLLIISFLGVVLVIRPGVRELHLGHLAIFCSVFLGALTTIILRHIAPRERRVSLVGLQVIYSGLFNGVLMLPFFVLPSLEQLAIFVCIGLMGGTGGLLLIGATKRSPASLVAPVQYSQLIWAIVFGAAFFGEYPDYVAVIGLVIVIAAGLANVMTEKLKIVWKPRVFFWRTGL
ncbi:EamA domain-containing membrane protein RarD [Devosia sp. YR412]|uniref:DMT family transporter n=1 Tax=Devosia sp. YR412 TaxID=1881030 RepID=UPI0008D684DB|nr:DMT family transporter [Devosia sp. YR412]SEP98170.1 EamA domain-containing membrane protein RarD [Devosia sp. YR412]